MAPVDQTNQQDSGNATEYFDPIGAARKGPLDVSTYSDAELFHHLSDPNKFRQAIPDYAHLSDDEIKGGMQRTGLRRPDLVKPPSMPDQARRLSGANVPGAPTDSSMSLLGDDPNLATHPRHPGDPNPGAADGRNLAEGLGEWMEQGPGTIDEGVKDFVTGNFARGIHKMASGAGATAVPATPLMLPTSPVPALIRGAIGGAAGAAVGKKAAEKLGASEDVSDVAGDASGLLAGGLLSGFTGSRQKFDANSAAHEIHGAVNPRIRFKGVGEQELSEFPDTEYEGEMQRQLPRLKQFADENGIQIKGKRELSMAAEGAGNSNGLFYREQVLGPHKNEMLPVKGIPGYGGEQITPGAATLDQLSNRLQDVNAELNPRYRKAGGGGQESVAAVRSESEARAEAQALRQAIYGELERRTGIPADQIQELNQGTAELHSIAHVTRRELAVEEAQGNKLRNQKLGATSGDGLTKEVTARVSQRLQPSPSDRRIANVFERLNVPGYTHPTPASPFNPYLRGSQPISGLPNRNPGQAGALAEIGQPTGRIATGAELSRGSQSSPVPAPISDALSSLNTTQPTGGELTTLPSVRPQLGHELGEREYGRETTAGEKQSYRRFMSENPSALADIPPSRTQRARVVQQTPTPPPAKSNPSTLGKIGEASKAAQDAEYTRLKARLKTLEQNQKVKNASNPTRDTALFQQIQKDHPEWNLSQVAQEAARRANPKGTNK